MIHSTYGFLYSAFDSNLIISDFVTFENDIKQLFLSTKNCKSGNVTSYTSYLNKENPNTWAVSICSVDGQRLSFGDSSHQFTLQSLIAPFLYSIAIDTYGADYINSKVGHEIAPGGASKNIILDDESKPHNPMINSGAILMSTLFARDKTSSERHKLMMTKLRQLGGIVKQENSEGVGFDYSAFMSERENCSRNSSITYFMRECGVIPASESVEGALDTYTQFNNITINTDTLSVMAATLANAGICPITGVNCLGPEGVKATLSQMLAAGMNDYSGQFAYRIGLPAKSGISGGLMVIVPNVMGIGLYSPCVDDHYNSVRSLEFIEQLVKQFRFHQFEPLRRRASVVNSSVELNDVEKAIVNLLAAQRNDVNRLIISFLENQDLNRHNDYDGSTLLHVAAGHNSFDYGVRTVRYFVI